MGVLRNFSEIMSEETRIWNRTSTDTIETTTPTHCPNCGNNTQGGSTYPRDTSSPDAFMYIVVVLSFYVFAMTVLMVKYIRRENREAQLSYYFQEFINRDKFNTPQYRNKQRVTAIKKTLSKFYQSMRFSDPDKSGSALQEVVSDGGSKSGSSVYIGSDSGVGSEKICHEDSDLVCSRECSDTEKCQSDDELLAQENNRAVLPSRDNIGDSDTEAKLLPQLRLKESAV